MRIDLEHLDGIYWKQVRNSWTNTQQVQKARLCSVYYHPRRRWNSPRSFFLLYVLSIGLGVLGSECYYKICSQSGDTVPGLADRSLTCKAPSGYYIRSCGSCRHVRDEGNCRIINRPSGFHIMLSGAGCARWKLRTRNGKSRVLAVTRSEWSASFAQSNEWSRLTERVNCLPRLLEMFWDCHTNGSVNGVWRLYLSDECIL